MASPNTARKEVIDMGANQDIRLVVEFIIKKAGTITDVVNSGGMEKHVQKLISDEGLFGIVDDEVKVLHVGIISDTDSGEACPGCFAPITLENVGGYRTYCMKCIKAFPEFPMDGNGYSIAGMYPNFKWV